MQNKHLGPPDHKESMPPAKQEIDYSSKTYTRGEQILSGVKMFAVIALFFILLWIADKYILN